MSGLGEVLETLRRARGLTQEALCARARVTQAALSRYENDLRTPDNDVAERLATALGVATSFLLRDHSVRGALALDVHMRRQRTARPSQWRRLEAALNARRLHMSLLLEEVSLRAERSVPTFDPLETSPADAARLVRAQWQMPVGPIRHLVRWLESAGCVIFEEDFGTARIDGLCQWIDDYPVLLINRKAPVDRKRLTLAHELAHLVLHNDFVSQDAEREANQFAAELLLPAHVIKPDLRSVNLGRMQDLKLEWGVSMQALCERAHELGVLSTVERQRFYKNLSTRGWRVHEPNSDQLAPEEPQLVAAIGSKLREKGLSSTEIAKLAGYSADAVDNPFLPPARRLQAV